MLRDYKSPVAMLATMLLLAFSIGAAVGEPSFMPDLDPNVRAWPDRLATFAVRHDSQSQIPDVYLVAHRTITRAPIRHMLRWWAREEIDRCIGDARSVTFVVEQRGGQLRVVDFAQPIPARMQRCIARAVAAMSPFAAGSGRDGERYVETLSWGPDAPPEPLHVEYRYQEEPPMPLTPRIDPRPFPNLERVQAAAHGHDASAPLR